MKTLKMEDGQRALLSADGTVLAWIDADSLRDRLHRARTRMLESRPDLPKAVQSWCQKPPTRNDIELLCAGALAAFEQLHLADARAFLCRTWTVPIRVRDRNSGKSVIVDPELSSTTVEFDDPWAFGYVAGVCWIAKAERTLETIAGPFPESRSRPVPQPVYNGAV